MTNKKKKIECVHVLTKKGKAMKTLKHFNAALKKAGIPTELVKGDGYFWYFSLDDLFFTPASVYVCHYSHMDSLKWQSEFDNVKREWESK